MVFNKFANRISGDSFKDFVFGFQDGLISTYVLLVGIALLVIFNPTMLVIALLAEITAGAISMGFGAYIATKTANEILEKSEQEQEDIVNDSIENLFDRKELSEEEVESIEKFFHEHPNLFQKLNKEGVEPRFKKDPVDNAILMALAFVLGGILPLAPYFIPIPTYSFIIATTLSFSGLFLIGIFRHVITNSKKHWIKPALEMVLLGILAVIIIGVYLYFISLLYGLIIFA